MIETSTVFPSGTGLEAHEVLDVLTRAAAAADRETLPRFRSKLAVDNKLAGGFDPVTEADRNAELAIRAEIEKAFPEHDIIGEEHEDKRNGSPFAWIIDPVDGTRAFISGVPLWGTLIAFAYKGRPIAGIMSQPFTGETFVAAPGTAVWRRGAEEQPLRTSGCTDIADARLFATAPELFSTPMRSAAWDAVRSASLQTRYGCDCYAYCLLAAGQADIVMEPALNVFDIAALIPIIEQAGGCLASWNGGSPDQGGDIIAAASDDLLDKALNLIARSR